MDLGVWWAAIVLLSGCQFNLSQQVEESVAQVEESIAQVEESIAQVEESIAQVEQPLQQLADDLFDNPMLSTYTDQELGITFTYPKSRWPIIKIHDMPWEQWIDFVSLKAWEKWIFGFANNKPSLWRDWFWWDGARAIQSLEALTTRCDRLNINTALGETCEIKTNNHGVTYVKSKQQYVEMGQEVWRWVVFYWLFNEWSPFPGIVWSNEMFRNEDESEFDALIQSVQFIQ
jgi:hypothetical protein